jgi:hypothetical protein
MKDIRREQIIEVIRREFIGPDPLPFEGMAQENGEEIITSDNPLIRYSAGILFPQGLNFTVENDEDQEEPDNNDNADTDSNSSSISDSFYNTQEMLEEAEDLINLSNAFKQSAVSITAAVYHDDKLFVSVNAGQYMPDTVPAEASKTGKAYKRLPVTWNNNSISLGLPDKNEPLKTNNIPVPINDAKLDFCITYRYTNNNYSVYTFTLVNSKEIDYATKSPVETDCFFQAEFELSSVCGFSPMPENSVSETKDDDYLINRLLYRNIKNYAIGHGCSADWEDGDAIVKKIKSSVIPSYEIKPILPQGFDNIKLKMFELSDYGDFKESSKELKSLCERYKEWIDERASEAKSIAPEYSKTAVDNIEKCLQCYRRMLHGIDLLEKDEKARKAFLYMNRAMLLQQLH